MAASLEGLAGLNNLLDLSATTVGELKDANKASAELILDDSQRNVAERSGALKRSGRATGTKRAGVVRYGKAKVPYANAYHFGHFGRDQGGFMRPDPFLYDSLDQRGADVVERYEKFVLKALADLGWE